MPKEDTQFKKGMTPWNKGTIGVMKPNSGNFKEGEHSGNFKGYGKQFIRIEKGRRPEIYTTTEEKIQTKGGAKGKQYMTRRRTTYARYLWKKTHGEIPKGMIVYNKDQENPLTIKIENLTLITRATLIKINSPNHKQEK